MAEYKTVRDELREWLGCIRSDAHILRERPSLLFQQAANQPDSTAPARHARRRLETGAERRPWLQWVNKPQRRSARLLTLLGHAGDVLDCAFSSDGTRLLSASSDGTARIWDAEMGRELETLQGHSASVTCCATSPVEPRAATGSADGTLRLWNLRTGEALHVLDAKRLEAYIREEVADCAFSPDGSLVLSAGTSGLTLWDADAGRRICDFENGRIDARACAFSPDGRRALAGYGSLLVAWDIDTRSELRTIDWHLEAVSAVAFSSDGSQFFSASGGDSPFGTSGMLKAWDAASYQEDATLWESKTAIRSITYSPTARAIAAAAGEVSRLFDPTTRSGTATLRHEKRVNACAFSPDGTRLLVGCADGVLQLWAVDSADTPSPSHALVLSGARAFSEDGARAVVKSSRDSFEVWDAGAGRARSSFSPPAAGTGQAGPRYSAPIAEAVAFVRRGAAVAVFSGHGTVSVVEAESGAMLTSFSVRKIEMGVAAAPFSPSRAWVASPNHDKRTLELYDLETGRLVSSLASPEGYVTSWAHSPSSSWIAAVVSRAPTDPRIAALVAIMEAKGTAPPLGTDTFRVWDAGTGAVVASVPMPGESPGWCGFSPDGNHVAVRTAVGIRLWSTEVRRFVDSIGIGGLDDCCFSFDSRLVVGCDEDTLAVLDARTGVEIARFVAEATIRGLVAHPRDHIFIAGELVVRLLNHGSQPDQVTPWLSSLRAAEALRSDLPDARVTLSDPVPHRGSLVFGPDQGEWGARGTLTCPACRRRDARFLMTQSRFKATCGCGWKWAGSRDELR